MRRRLWFSVLEENFHDFVADGDWTSPEKVAFSSIVRGVEEWGMDMHMEMGLTSFRED